MGKFAEETCRICQLLGHRGKTSGKEDFSHQFPGKIEDILNSIQVSFAIEDLISFVFVFQRRLCSLAIHYSSSSDQLQHSMQRPFHPITQSPESYLFSVHQQLQRSNGICNLCRSSSSFSIKFPISRESILLHKVRGRLLISPLVGNCQIPSIFRSLSYHESEFLSQTRREQGINRIRRRKRVLLRQLSTPQSE